LTRRFWRLVGVLGVLLLWLVSGILLLPRRDPAPAIWPKYVIALGGSVSNDSVLDHAARTRLETAVEIARRTGATVFTTFDENDGETTTGGQRRVIAAAGWLDHWRALYNPRGTTRTDAQVLVPVVPPPTPIVVVTSPLHTRRGCAVYERLGYQVTCLASAQYRWWLVPEGVAYEEAALFKYRWKGWI
jgi:uncharacterized SAM-binding protein YcdF (DUF218 family)